MNGTRGLRTLAMDESWLKLVNAAIIKAGVPWSDRLATIERLREHPLYWSFLTRYRVGASDLVITELLAQAINELRAT